MGFSSIRLLTTFFFWQPGTSTAEPDLNRIRANTALLDQNELQVIDIEHWPTSGSEAVIADTIRKFTEIVQVMREVNPNLVIGIYGMLPVRDYWTPVLYNNDTTQFQAWEAKNQRLQELADLVDVILPSIYTFYPDYQQNGAPRLYERDRWVEYATENLLQARSYGKPVFSFVWPHYHGGGGSNDPSSPNYRYWQYAPISTEFWQIILETSHQYADSTIVFDWNLAGTYDETIPRPWDDNFPWYLETRDHIDKTYPVPASSESTMFGTTVSGLAASKYSENDNQELIEETYNNSTQSRLQHDWAFFTATTARAIAVEGHRETYTASEDFTFSYSTDGNDWLPMPNIQLPLLDDAYFEFPLPDGIVGTIYVRVEDTDRSPGENFPDRVHIDQIGVIAERPVESSWPTVSLTNVTTVPGTSVQFTLTRSGSNLSRATFLAYETIDGTGDEGVDYTSAELATIKFAENQTQVTVTIPWTLGRQYERDRDFTLRLSRPVNAYILDVLPPLVHTATFAPPLITQQDQTQDVTLSVLFTEDMDTLQTPAITNDHPSMLTNPHNGRWFDPRTYQLDYTVGAGNVEISDIFLNVSAAFDASGNVMEAVSELPTATRIDTLADIVISPIANNGIVDDTADNSLVISGTTVGVDDGQLVSIAVSGDVFSGTAAVQNNAWSVPIGDLSWLSDGSSYSVSVAVADVAGNSAATSSAFQLINTINDPPTLALAVSDYTILEGTGLQFNGAGAYDPDDPTLIYGWDLDGDGQFDDATGMSPIITWLDLVSLGRNDDGDYPGEVQVSDDEGLSAQATISLHIVNVAPDLSISSNFVATLLAGTAQVAGVYDDIMADPVTIIASKGNITDFGAGQFLWDYDATSDPFVRSLGPLNAGIAVHDSADGSGFVLFSSESVFARFADHPPLGGGVNGNAEHLVAVQFRGGQWYYSDDSDWILFVPVESDRIIARLDFDNDTANLVTAVTGDVNGIRQGTRANNLALTPNAFGGQADVGEFTLSGSFFHDAFGTVTITATDDEQATSSVDIAVLLGNVPPELTVAWPAISVVEGTQAAVNGGTWQPGSSTYGTPVADIGVVLDNGDGSWSWSLDNPGDEQSRRTVTVTVSDGQGAESVVQFDVEFTNADPVISMDSSEPITVLEGDMATRLISVTDVLLDNVSVVASIGIVTKNADGTWTWTYDATDDLPTTTVTITATDEDGGVANAEFGLTVANRPPLIAADSASLTVNEGDGVVTMTGTYEDVAADELELVPSLGQVVDQGDGTWLWSYDAVDDVSELVTITVADDDDGTAFATFDFTALNVAPLVTVGSNNVMGYEGVIASASGTWSDVPGDPLRFTPSIGEVVVNGNGTWEWTYAAADDLAPMLVTVSVVDNDGGEVEFEFTFSALNVSPSFTISLDEVIVPEDEPAANFGTITDVAGDTITLSSNLGDVSLDGFNNWTWDFADTHQPVAFDLGSTSSGVAVGANAIGMAYILYSEEDIAGRFTTTPSQMDVTFENAERMVVVREAAGSWEFNDGADWIPFAKRPTDRLLAEVDLGTGTVTLLQGANTVVAGIRVGYGFGDVLVSTGTLNSGGTLRQFSVAGTFFESDIATVVLIASDEDGGKSEAVFDVTIIAANDDPVALPDEHAVAEDDEAVEIPVLSNDSDIDRFDVISIESVDVTGTLGLVTVVDGFELRYDPSGQFEWLADGELATDTFSYTISDAAGSQSGATVVVTIVGANDAPISVVDSNVAEEDGAAATGNVLSNDSDVDNGDVLAVVAPGTFIGQYGEWTLSADGNYSYVVTDEAIDDDDVVADTFDFEVTDGEVVVASQFVVEIVGANDAPVALDDANNASDDGVAVVGNVLANDDDVDTGDVLSVANVGTQLGTYGTLTLSADGSYSYLVTDESLMATDAVDDVFAIDVSDGTDVVTSTLTIHITGVNNAPQAMLDSNHAADDGVTVFGNVLANDSDPDGGDVLVIVASGTFIGQYGEWTLSADGNYSYVVTDEAIDDGDVVADAFDFEVTDGEIVVSSQFVVEIDGANDAPVVLEDANNASDDGDAVVGNVLANDDDVDTGDVLSVANGGTHLGTYGTLTLSADGSYSYLVTDESLMAADAVDDVFAIDVSDGTDVVSSALTIHITGVNDAPHAMLDSNYATDDGVTVFGNVLTNDSDPDGGDVLAIVTSGTFIGQYGELTLSADGNYSYVVTDEAIDDGDVVADTFDFEVTDGEVVVSSQFVVEIDGANDAPVVLEDANNASDDGDAVVGNVLANDDDVDTGDALSVANVGTHLGTYGTLTLSTDGSYSYLVTDESLMATDAVDDVFAIDVSDGTDVVTSTLTIHITGVNDDPQAMLDSNHAADDGVTVFGNVLTNDSDPDGGDVLAIVTSGTFIGQYGEWTLGGDGSYQYIVTDETLGFGDAVTETFYFEVTDGEAVVSSQLEIDILGANDVPTINSPLPDRLVDEDSTFSFSVPMSTFTDIDTGDVLAISAEQGNGSPLPSWLAFDAPYGFVGTPTNDAVGTWSIAVTATDIGGQYVIDVFNLTVINRNDAPVVSMPIDDLVVNEDEPLLLVLPESTFSDVDIGDTLNLTASLSDGAPLPNWLTFGTEFDEFVGTPSNDDVGTYLVRVTATDMFGPASVSDVFSITVRNINDAPTITNPVGDQNTNEDEFFRLELPSNEFSDVDAGDALSLLASLVGGDPLPGWLTFDGIGSFEGTPSHVDVGTLSISVTAMDTGGLSVSDEFDIVVNAANVVPYANDDFVTTNEDTAVLFNVVDGSVGVGSVADMDADGTIEVESLDVVQTAGHGQLVNNFDGTLTYLPDANWHGMDQFTYRIADNHGDWSNVAVVEIEVRSDNDVGSFTGDLVATIDEDTSASGTITLVDPIDGATSPQFVLFQMPASGVATVTSDGDWTYIPDHDFYGNDTFVISAHDDDGNLEFALVSMVVNSVADVVGRHIFYNNSYFDGNSPQADERDDGAIAPDKTALLPGETGSFANYTSYSRGINGIMIDIEGLAAIPTLENLDEFFAFRVGNDNNFSDPGWSTAPTPADVTSRPLDGTNGVERITIIWNDLAIGNMWLEVKVLADRESTRLTRDDLHYWGNAVGESGNDEYSTAVSGADQILARDNFTTFQHPVDLVNRYDFNRDRFITGADQIVARDNFTTFARTLVFLSPGPNDGVPPMLHAASLSPPITDNFDVDSPMATPTFGQDELGFVKVDVDIATAAEFEDPNERLHRLR